MEDTFVNKTVTLRFYFPGLSDMQVNTDHLRERKVELPDPRLLFPLSHNLTHSSFSKSQE